MWIDTHDDVVGLRDIRKVELIFADIVEKLLAENHSLRLKLGEFGIIHTDHSAREQTKIYLSKIYAEH